MSGIPSFTALDLITRYRSRRLSPVEVVKDIQSRIDRFEPRVNAFVLRDDAVALEMAQASEARWLKGEQLGALDGVPVTIKDNLGVAGWPTRRGSALASPAPETEDSPIVARIREAGAVFVGKTTMPEYGWKGVGDSPLSGITRNPWDLSKTPGGSSAGAAACAALNLGCIHLGTDGAGSIRIPAAFTGVFGLKPTYGHIPAHPISTMGFLAHLGVLTRTVRDTALALNVIGWPDIRDMTATQEPIQDYLSSIGDGLRGLRIAYSPKLGFDVEVDPEIAAAVAASVRRFEVLGAIVEEVDPGFADPIEPLMAIWSAGAALALKTVSAEDRRKMDPGLVAIAEAGEQLSAADYVNALLYQRNTLAVAMARFHARYDLLITPSLAVPAFEAGRLTPAHGRYGEDWTRWTPFSYPFNLTQQPAASIPCGLTKAGLPIGMQIVGAFGADRLVLRAAAAFESENPYTRLSEPRESAETVA